MFPQMSEAGFYYVGTESEPDLARCYWCRRELGGWEPTDDPWEEHRRRPCPFIGLGKRQEELTVEELKKLEKEKTVLVMVRQFVWTRTV